MHIILGATGHIGSTLSQLLLERGEPVTVVTRDPHQRETWERKGARVAVLDITDVDALRGVFETGKRAYVLNPPAPPASDTVAVERKTASALLSALAGSGLERVVAQSTYGAQPGAALGDLGVLCELERGLEQLSLPFTIIRGAYYMSNWDTALATARSESRVHTLLPAHFKLPMVAPQDIARVAAELLTEPLRSQRLQYVEGPARYSAGDVAGALSEALGKQVEVATVPPARWLEALQNMGFSAAAAESMAAMTRVTLSEDYELPNQPTRGSTTLMAYIQRLVRP
jgi:uncharacterized protein YbjT (DUF2867 family)